MEERMTPEEIVVRFRERRLSRDDWDHRAHLIVGLYYLLTYNLDVYSSMCNLKLALIAFNNAVGYTNNDQTGYHETITAFWLLRIEEFVRRSKLHDFESLAASLSRKRSFYERDFAMRWYSEEELFSVRARAVYLLPTRKGKWR